MVVIHSRKGRIIIMYLILIYDIKQEKNYEKRQRMVFKTYPKISV